VCFADDRNFVTVYLTSVKQTLTHFNTKYTNTVMRLYADRLSQIHYITNDSGTHSSVVNCCHLLFTHITATDAAIIWYNLINKICGDRIASG